MNKKGQVSSGDSPEQDTFQLHETKENGGEKKQKLPRTEQMSMKNKLKNHEKQMNEIFNPMLGSNVHISERKVGIVNSIIQDVNDTDTLIDERKSIFVDGNTSQHQSSANVDDAKIVSEDGTKTWYNMGSKPVLFKPTTHSKEYFRPSGNDLFSGDNFKNMHFDVEETGFKKSNSHHYHSIFSNYHKQNFDPKLHRSKRFRSESGSNKLLLDDDCLTERHKSTLSPKQMSMLSTDTQPEMKHLMIDGSTFDSDISPSSEKKSRKGGKKSGSTKRSSKLRKKHHHRKEKLTMKSNSSDLERVDEVSEDDDDDDEDQSEVEKQADKCEQLADGQLKRDEQVGNDALARSNLALEADDGQIASHETKEPTNKLRDVGRRNTASFSVGNSSEEDDLEILKDSITFGGTGSIEKGAVKKKRKHSMNTEKSVKSGESHEGTESDKKSSKKNDRAKHRISHDVEGLRNRQLRGSELRMHNEFQADEAAFYRIMDESKQRHHLCSRSSFVGDVGGTVEDKIGTVNTEKRKKVNNYDHTPHDLFVELDVLEGDKWIEASRWIKYEESRETGSERWGQPHVSPLTFHSVINLRLCLCQALLIFDLEAHDFTQIVENVVQGWFFEKLVDDDMVHVVYEVLHRKHKHVSDGAGFSLKDIKRNFSHRAMSTSFNESDRVNRRLSFSKSKTFVDTLPSSAHPTQQSYNHLQSGNSKDHVSVNIIDCGDTDDDHKNKSSHHTKKESVFKRLKLGTEGSTVLSGRLDGLEKPLVAFVRLAEGIIMPNELELSIPIRFVFVALIPKNSPDMDHLEIGRAFSTLLSNPEFHNKCYEAQERYEILQALMTFLDDSFVLPPTEWDNRNLLSISEIAKLRNRRKRKQTRAKKMSEMTSFPSSPHMARGHFVSSLKENKKSIRNVLMGSRMTKSHGSDGDSQSSCISSSEDEMDCIISGKTSPDMEEEILTDANLNRKLKPRLGPHNDPLIRTGHLFGGLINDVWRRYPWYISDIVDGLNAQCFATIIFIYFACLSGAIAFGGLMADKTHYLIGIPETLLFSSIAGILFALLAGQPLIIIGVTGPVLLYDEALFNLSQILSLDFLAWRVWIGIWLIGLALLVAAFEGSTLVNYFTKFTKDIFASLVSLLFIYEAINKLKNIFQTHPLVALDVYCNETIVREKEMFLRLHNTFNLSVEELLKTDDVRTKLMNENLTSIDLAPLNDVYTVKKEPNTALLSAILMFGTFFISYFLRIFRNSNFFGRTIRRALGDFGVPISILIMVFSDWLIHDTYTQKLNVPSGIAVTDPTQRGWVISPLGREESFKVEIIFMALPAAILLYCLLFMETHICELLMKEKSNRKGCGIHLDIVLLCTINCLGSVFGGPWICAATVRAVSHVSSLSVMSTTHAPGESVKIVQILDQRLTSFTVSVLVGLSILLAPALKLIPYAVLFGIFLYMGVSSIHGIQFFDRFKLFFMPTKHHQEVSYVKKVPTWKMNVYTGIQAACLAILWAVKSTILSLAFPFFVIAMVPLRISLKYFFTPRELDALDGPHAGQLVDDKDRDFYDQAYGS